MINRAKTATATNVGFTHEDFAKLLDKYDYHFSPGDIVATIFHSLGLDHTGHLPGPAGRPFALTDFGTEPIGELFA